MKLKNTTTQAALLAAACSMLLACDTDPDPMDAGPPDARVRDVIVRDAPIVPPDVQPDVQPDAQPCVPVTPSSPAELAASYLFVWSTDDAAQRRCAIESVFAADATYRSSAGVFSGHDAIETHIEATQTGTRTLTSGTPMHHSGMRFSWENGATGGISLARLDDAGQLSEVTDHSGPVASGFEDLGPYEQYLAAWNEADPATRATLIEESWAEEGDYADPTAAGVGRGALDAIIRDYLNFFDARAIVIREFGNLFEGAYWVRWAIRNAANDADLIEGMDFCLLDADGTRIASLFSFFGPFAEVGVGGNVGDCLTCIEQQVQGADPAGLCTMGTPPSTAIFGGVAGCVCSTACPAVCGDNLCVGMPPSAECGSCIGNPGLVLEACPAETAACWNDG